MLTTLSHCYYQMFLLNFFKFKHLIYLSFEGVQSSPQVIAHTITQLAYCSTEPALPLEVGLHVPDTSQQPHDLPHGTPQFSSLQAAELVFFSLSLTKTKNQHHCVSDTDIKRQLSSTIQCLI